LFDNLSGKKIVLFVGRLVEQKGVDSLIKAFGNLSRDRPNLMLCVVGDGPMKPYLHRLSLKLNITDKILWFNYVPHDIIPYLYASSTVFVLPSSIEPLGIAILEAMASGKPVISTKVGGIPDIISDGVNGILVEPNNVPALESALRILLSKEKLATRMGEEGRRLAERKFSWEIIGKKIVSIYEQAIHESSSGKKRVD
jgi:glycosyltransferase involved in cell wall biosynthesis